MTRKRWFCGLFGHDWGFPTLRVQEATSCTNEFWIAESTCLHCGEVEGVSIDPSIEKHPEAALACYFAIRMKDA